MNKNRILVVYNTCGLAYPPDIKRWTEEIQLLVEQSLKGVKIVHSDCGSQKKDRDLIKSTFGNKISYYHTSENLPIQQTCNHAVKKMIEAHGRFESYCYLGSGVSFHNKNHLAYAYKMLKENNDIAKIDYHVIRHPEIPERFEEMHPPNDFYISLNKNTKQQYYVMKPGQRVNNHCALFSDDYCLSYDNRLLPDCFAGNGAEGIYSLLTSALNKKHVVMSYNYCPSVYHKPNADGANQFLKEQGIETRTYLYDWIYKSSVDLDFLNEEYGSIGFICDTQNNEICAKQQSSNKFDNFGLPKTKEQQEKLLEIIKNNIFVSNKIIDYDKIECEFIK